LQVRAVQRICPYDGVTSKNARIPVIGVPVLTKALRASHSSNCHFFRCRDGYPWHMAIGAGGCRT